MAAISTEKADSKKLSEFGRMLFVIFPLTILGWFGSTFVFILLWRWFVTPLGIKPLTFWHGFGLMMLIIFVRYDNKLDKEDGKRGPDYWSAYLRRGFAAMISSLALGWLAHLLMGRG